ncbi:MAG: glycosyl hydrolase 53 family protein [Terricaulis sp.]
MSVSPFTEAVLAQCALSDGQTQATTVMDVQKIFNRHGATEVYQRIATKRHATDGNQIDHGLDRGLERARLARDLSMPFNPEIGTFAHYGDVAYHQEAPDFSDFASIHLPAQRWTDLTIEQMLDPLRAYGALVAREILATGVTVNVWDIGNEVEMGMTGVAVRPLVRAEDYVAPDNVDPELGRRSVMELIQSSESDRISWSRTHLWPHIGQLAGAVAQGIRSVDRHARFSTHISSFGQKTPTIAAAFWDTLRENGYLPDHLGCSFWGLQGSSMYGPSDTLAWLRDTASALKQRFDRPMFLAEYGYPSAHMPPPFTWNDLQPGYGQDEDGQFHYTRDVIAWALESGAISGVRPWAPDYCTSPGWGPMAWFRRDGATAVARPVLDSLAAAVRQCQNAPAS